MALATLNGSHFKLTVSGFVTYGTGFATDDTGSAVCVQSAKCDYDSQCTFGMYANPGVKWPDGYPPLTMCKEAVSVCRRGRRSAETTLASAGEAGGRTFGPGRSER